jgi:hypothetical protein
VRFGEFEERTVPQADPVRWATYTGDGFRCEVQVVEHRRQPVDGVVAGDLPRRRGSGYQVRTPCPTGGGRGSRRVVAGGRQVAEQDLGQHPVAARRRAPGRAAPGSRPAGVLAPTACLVLARRCRRPPPPALPLVPDSPAHLAEAAGAVGRPEAVPLADVRQCQGARRRLSANRPSCRIGAGARPVGTTVRGGARPFQCGVETSPRSLMRRAPAGQRQRSRGEVGRPHPCRSTDEPGTLGRADRPRRSGTAFESRRHHVRSRPGHRAPRGHRSHVHEEVRRARCSRAPATVRRRGLACKPAGPPRRGGIQSSDGLRDSGGKADDPSHGRRPIPARRPR